MIATTLLAYAVTIGVLVTFHEFGHYWVARLCGIKVLRFSVGFGKILYSRRFGKGETEWAFSAIPLGGYVKMLDEREGEVAPHELARAFNRKPAWQRMAVVAAGPVFNLLLAIFLYFALFVHGIPGIKPLIGVVPAGTPGAQAQFQPREEILAINGDETPSWNEVNWRLLNLALRRGQVEVTGRTPDGVVHRHELDMSSITPSDLRTDFMKKLGLQPYEPVVPAVINEIQSGSAAARAGLQPGDTVLRADGGAVEGFDQWAAIVRSHPGKALHMEVSRDGRQVSIELTPDAITDSGQIIGRAGAIHYNQPSSDMLVEVKYGPLGALRQGLEKTWDISTLSLEMIGRMAMGQVSVRNLSGPIKTATVAGTAAQMGVIPYLFVLALISVSVGVLNLLPIPILDGGHLLYYMAEFFTGRPVPERAWETGQKIGAALLFALMLLVFYNDISSLIFG
jgi:regulator of sigma E protease